MPFGTRGGTRIRYTFPMDGEYVIKVRLARDLNDGMPAYADPQNLEVSLDGERLQVFTLPGLQPLARGQRGQRTSSTGAAGARGHSRNTRGAGTTGRRSHSVAPGRSAAPGPGAQRRRPR